MLRYAQFEEINMETRSQKDRLSICNISASIMHLLWCVFLITYGSIVTDEKTGWNQHLPVFCKRNVWCAKVSFLERNNASFLELCNVTDVTCGSSSKELCAGDHYLNPQFRAMDRSVELIPEMYECTYIASLPLVISFFALSSIFHLYNFLSLKNDDDGCESWYLKDLHNGYSLSRFTEYSISASVMIIIICYFLGINDLNTLVSFFFLIFAVQWMGYAAEWGRNGAQYFFHIMGWILMLVVIILTSIQWNDTLKNADSAPEWLWILIAGDFFLFSTFAFAQMWQLCGGCCGCYFICFRCPAPSSECCGFGSNPHIQGEYIFIILSFVCKSFLGVIASMFVIGRNVVENLAEDAGI